MSDPAGFYALTRNARKVLAIENPALGDAIHLLPALKLLRDNYPQAQLQVVSGLPAFFQSVAPWVDKAWPQLARRPLDNLGLIRNLRRERIDAVFVFSGHNRAGLVANLVGARWRVGRRTDHNKPWWWQPLLYTSTVDLPWHREPMYLQHWQLLKRCGLQGEHPDFGARVRPEWLREIGLGEARKTYLHVSPYYAFAGKELPVEQYVELLTRLQQRYGRLILSCAPPERERGLLEALVKRLPFEPFRVYAGKLSLDQYIGLIDGARLHLSGDSGGLHVARMVGTPSVCWYRRRWDYLNWAPGADEPAHRVIFTEDTAEDACHGISGDALVAAVQDLLGP
ncbi:MAG: glycosyltransferase family 9 protein [Nevskia sp.]|nr:glycosyltransferase family 9 protein [Nevskia sp.]